MGRGRGLCLSVLSRGISPDNPPDNPPDTLPIITPGEAPGILCRLVGVFLEGSADMDDTVATTDNFDAMGTITVDEKCEGGVVVVVHGKGDVDDDEGQVEEFEVGIKGDTETCDEVDDGSLMGVK